MNTMQFTDTQLDVLTDVVRFLREHRRKRLAAFVYRFFVPDVPMAPPIGQLANDGLEEWEAYQEEIAA